MACDRPLILLEEFGPVTFRCHVCGLERLDADIGVRKATATLDGAPLLETRVRFCVGRPECCDQSASLAQRRLAALLAGRLTNEGGDHRHAENPRRYQQDEGAARVAEE
jgi:hypothetical protein